MEIGPIRNQNLIFWPLVHVLWKIDEGQQKKLSRPTDNQIYGLPANQFSPSPGTTLGSCQSNFCLSAPSQLHISRKNNQHTKLKMSHKVPPSHKLPPRWKRDLESIRKLEQQSLTNPPWHRGLKFMTWLLLGVTTYFLVIQTSWGEERDHIFSPIQRTTTRLRDRFFVVDQVPRTVEGTAGKAASADSPEK